jgi:signal transduction histidine kinase
MHLYRQAENKLKARADELAKLNMEALINGLLQYSRVGRIKGDLQTVDVGALLAEVLDSLDPPSEFRIKIEGEMPTLVTELLPLQQVFINLISNAIKPVWRSHIR